MLRVLLQSFPRIGLILLAVLAGCATTETQTTSRTVERSPIDAKEEQMSILSDQVERQQKAIEKLTQTVEDLRQELSGTKRTPTSGANQATPGAAVGGANVPSVPVVVPPAVKKSDSDDDDDDDDSDGDSDIDKRSGLEKGEVVADASDESMHWYYEGVQYQKEQKYDDSVRAFREFLKVAPEHVYADRAQFLIADSYFRNHEFNLAVINTNLLESKYPASFKLPEALLTRAVSYLKLGQSDDARLTLKEILSRFPSDPAADEAAKKLADLSDVAAPAAPISAPVTGDKKTAPPQLIQEID